MWYGKDKPIKPEPRILIKNDKNSNLGKDGTSENLLIHGYRLNIVHNPDEKDKKVLGSSSKSQNMI